MFQWKLIHVYFVAILGLFLLEKCVTLESREPEVLLQPRNFNPHPYQEGGRPAPNVLRNSVVVGATGPVLFPASPPDDGEQPHPYAIVAKKHRDKFRGQFDGDERINNISPRYYNGLANYAAKVLKKPVFTHQNGYDPSLSAQKKNYAFSYSVHDQATGDDFSHSQSQNARATNGEYRVKLPDGRVQIVSYTADRNGYKADVKYEDEPRRKPQLQPQVVVATADYDYYEDQRGQVSQIEVPLYEDDGYKYQIYADDQGKKFVGGQGTPVAYSQANILGYEGVIVSTVAPQRFSQVYITTPKYNVVHGAAHHKDAYFQK